MRLQFTTLARILASLSILGAVALASEAGLRWH
jgi:hypothetical protein